MSAPIGGLLAADDGQDGVLPEAGFHRVHDPRRAGPDVLPEGGQFRLCGPCAGLPVLEVPRVPVRLAGLQGAAAARLHRPVAHGVTSSCARTHAGLRRMNSRSWRVTSCRSLAANVAVPSSRSATTRRFVTAYTVPLKSPR